MRAPVISWTIAVIVTLGTASLFSQAPATQDRARMSAAELDQGQLLIEHKEYFEALKRLRRANELLANRCARCVASMAEAMLGMKAYQNALDTAQNALDLADGDEEVVGAAHLFRGQAFEALAEKDAARLEDAEAEFREAVATSLPRRLAEAHFYLGIVLMKQQRDEEGIAELKRTIAYRPDSFLADDAAALIADPRRARDSFAPDFSIVAAGGGKISLEALRGKVVLLDFWTTLCPSCVRAVPALQKVQKAHANDRFVMLAVSADENEVTWRRFTAKNNMTWPQFFDETRSMSSKFRITAYPTYVLIDGEGREVTRSVGRGFHEVRQMETAIRTELAKLAAAER